MNERVTDLWLSKSESTCMGPAISLSFSDGYHCREVIDPPFDRYAVAVALMRVADHLAAQIREEQKS